MVYFNVFRPIQKINLCTKLLNLLLDLLLFKIDLLCFSSVLHTCSLRFGIVSKFELIDEIFCRLKSSLILLVILDLN